MFARNRVYGVDCGWLRYGLHVDGLYECFKFNFVGADRVRGRLLGKLDADP